MSNLGPQKILFSYNGLLQVPGGLTSSLQYVTDANGVSSGIQISTTGFSGAVISDTVTITGGTINGTTIGAVNPAAGTFSTLKVDSLAGILKATTGTVSAATANTDYLTPPSGTAILKANSGGALANATSGVDYAPATSGTSILKANGSGGFTNAASGVDYAPATSGTSIVYGNGAGGFSNVTVGSGLQFSGGTLVSTSGGGSVTTVSVVSANGFTGTVANASSTPAITLATSVTGLLKGNGTAISAATSGTDYAPATSGTSILKGDNAGGFSAAVAGTDYAGLASANTFTNNQVISVNSSSDALRITQTGAGNALVVEDSANPDSTPTVIDANGNLIVGGSSPITEQYGGTARLTVNTFGDAYYAIGAATFTNDVFPSIFSLLKSRSTTSGGQTIVQQNDTLGSLRFQGSDGVGFINAAQISVEVDGTPGTNDMPGRLVFSTTADGASSPTERMRIDNQGRVGIGSIAAAFARLQVAGTLPSSSAFSYGISSAGTVPSTSTSGYVGFDSAPSTQATAFTLAALTHFQAYQSALGAGSTVTTQYGFHANASLTGATNNYGFYSNIASGTGRYNFYAAGTAANYFAGVTTYAAGLNEQKTAPSISAGTLTLNCSAGNVFAVSLNANITTLSFSNVPASGIAYALTLSFTADGTARSVTWGSSVKWPGGTAPTLTSTNGKVDTFVLTTWDGGTTWYAFTAGQNA